MSEPVCYKISSMLAWTMFTPYLFLYPPFTMVKPLLPLIRWCVFFLSLTAIYISCFCNLEDVKTINFFFVENIWWIYWENKLREAPYQWCCVCFESPTLQKRAIWEGSWVDNKENGNWGPDTCPRLCSWKFWSSTYSRRVRSSHICSRNCFPYCIGRHDVWTSQ